MAVRTVSPMPAETAAQIPLKLGLVNATRHEIPARSSALVFDLHYQCGPRSDDFMLISITAGRVRDTATKKAFYKRLVELLADAPGIRQEDVMVVITTTQADEWSFGAGEATMVQ